MWVDHDINSTPFPSSSKPSLNGMPRDTNFGLAIYPKHRAQGEFSIPAWCSISKSPYFQILLSRARNTYGNYNYPAPLIPTDEDVVQRLPDFTPNILGLIIPEQLGVSLPLLVDQPGRIDF